MLIPESLFRAGSLDVIERFLKEGEIRFRPLSFYRKVEDVNRADDLEGAFSTNANGVTIEIFDEESSSWIHPMKLIKGRMTHSLKPGLLESMHVSCFSVERQIKFGSAVAEIYNVPQFLETIKAGLKQVGISLQWRTVRYYDESTPQRPPEAENLWWRKRNKFAGEKEFRIGFVVERRNYYATLFPTKFGSANQDIPDFITFRFGSFESCVRLV